jgi:hypothetical protein
MEDLKREYIQYLILLYRLEEENGINVGDYPEFDEWLTIRKEEDIVWHTIH